MIALAAVLLALASAPPVSRAVVLDLEGRPVDALSADGAKATVFVFVHRECPIANRYAPELVRLHGAFAPRGIRFLLVYPDPAETPPAIRRHMAEYGYAFAAVRDPDHVLVGLAGARVTPEVAVRAGDSWIYRGRIDDRYADLATRRAAPTSRDLEAALEAFLAGRPVPRDRTHAVGCFIAPPPARR